MSITQDFSTSQKPLSPYKDVIEHHYDRVRAMTANSVNEKIDLQTERIIQGVIAQGPESIQKRLQEIDREWDVERVFVLNFSSLVFLQLLAARKNKKWLWGPLIQTPFLFMHSTLGWCPPLMWFRPMGFRTRKEIQSERETLLKALGDHRVLQ